MRYRIETFIISAQAVEAFKNGSSIYTLISIFLSFYHILVYELFLPEEKNSLYLHILFLSYFYNFFFSFSIIFQ